MIVRAARPPSLPVAGERFVVVEASAGTGKTYFLEHRVADLVIGGAELSQILLVTFTDKAVAELRMRIRDLLDRLSRLDVSTDSEPAWELDDAARARLRAAVIAFDHAPIFTIHGFCHRVLIEDAFAARRLFQQEQVADEVAFDSAFSALLRERFSIASPDRELLAAYLRYKGTTEQLRKVLLDCSRKDARARRRFDPEAALALGQRLRDELGSPERRAAILQTCEWGNQSKKAPGWLDELAAGLERWDGTAIGVLALCDDIGERADALTKRYTSKRPVLHEALLAVKRMMSLEEAIAIELLPHVMTRIAADKAERGMFDYKDMLELVRDALRGERGPELAHRLRERTPWVMIDEFQDTDEIQWEIFKTVWLHEEARGLTIVGDPKQAIYGFRGADVATYMDARDQLLGLGAHRVSLEENRRSVAPLVEAVNTLINQPLNELLDQDIRYEHPVRAAGDIACEGSRPPITVFQLVETAAEDDLAAAIGEEIERLRARPPAWRHRGTSPAFSLGQVMVLTRSNKESSEVAASLRARGLACAVVESEKLFKTREAAELAAVLAAIAAPRDRSARLRALRTRFFDVKWTELMRVVDAPDHHPAIARLFDWAALAAKREYEALFRRLIDDSRFAARTLVCGGGERAVINTWHVIELLLEEVSRSRGDLNELVTQLRRWIDQHDPVEEDRDIQRAETDADAVRVLTIHKAKGLEAPYVFLYGAASKPGLQRVHTLHDSAGRALVVTTKMTPELEAEEAAENERLAYVALTRAQVRMYLPLYGERVDKRSTYHHVQRCLAPLVNTGHGRFEVIAVAAENDPQPPADALASFDVPPPPALAEIAPVTRAGLAMWSYTRLAHDLAIARSADLSAAEIERAELDADADAAAPDARDELPADELPPGSDSGLFLHDLFEHVDLRVAEATAEQLADFGRQRGIAPAYHAHAARLVRETLVQPLGDLPPLVEATALAREVEFAYPIPGAPGRGLVKGFIDALVVYGDDLWVLDYKSDRLANPARAKEHAFEHYGVQARLYSLAADKLRGSRALRGVLFAFVRHGVVVPITVDGDALATYASWLEGLR
ncbi:MAG: UvrD-helicase domain-containing protein [Deltaproteobacteria bacterium]|nr:UvrD-helicase domain-containing protein [Deltaproteobacteria bacterium]